MAHGEKLKASGRWRRNRRVRRLKQASSETFSGCTGDNICYGVPFPGPQEVAELSEEDLARFEKILSQYL